MEAPLNKHSRHYNLLSHSKQFEEHLIQLDSY
jgi:hypothetical protein